MKAYKLERTAITYGERPPPLRTWYMHPDDAEKLKSLGKIQSFEVEDGVARVVEAPAQQAKSSKASPAT